MEPKLCRKQTRSGRAPAATAQRSSNESDKIFGQAGKDYLTGGAGNDMIVGGRGRDVISCGARRDPPSPKGPTASLRTANGWWAPFVARARIFPASACRRAWNNAEGPAQQLRPPPGQRAFRRSPIRLSACPRTPASRPRCSPGSWRRVRVVAPISTRRRSRGWTSTPRTTASVVQLQAGGRWSTGGARNLVFRTGFDGGATWTNSPLQGVSRLEVGITSGSPTRGSAPPRPTTCVERAFRLRRHVPPSRARSS